MGEISGAIGKNWQKKIGNEFWWSSAEVLKRCLIQTVVAGFITRLHCFCPLSSRVLPYHKDISGIFAHSGVILRPLKCINFGCTEFSSIGWLRFAGNISIRCKHAKLFEETTSVAQVKTKSISKWTNSLRFLLVSFSCGLKQVQCQFFVLPCCPGSIHNTNYEQNESTRRVKTSRLNFRFTGGLEWGLFAF